MLWSGWYLLLSIFPLTILFLLMKDGIRLVQHTARQSWQRRRRQQDGKGMRADQPSRLR